MRKRLIEWGLPLAAIFEESVREKYFDRGRTSTLYIWWARHPLASLLATANALLNNA